MARLVVLRDPLRGVREWHTLEGGATLANELRRLYPEGFGAAWTLYKSETLLEGALDPAEHERLTVDDASTYIVTVRPLGGFDIVAFAWSLVVSLIISGITYLLTPKPRTSSGTTEESKESPNNQLAGQSNQLRAGARVPDILGRVRSYPDLLTAPVERWYWPHTQSIVQHFVIGRGAYLIDERRLGETLFTSIDGISWADFAPGDVLSGVQAIRIAPNVDGISLIAQDSATTASGVTFNAAAKTVTSAERIGIVKGKPYFVTGTLFNTADFWVDSEPPSDQTVGPYVYALNGPVANETSNAIFNDDTYRTGDWQWINFATRGVASEIKIPVNHTAVVGDLVSLSEVTWGVPGGFYFEGKVTYVEHGGAGGSETWIRCANMDGTAAVFAVAYREIITSFYVPAGAPVRALPSDAPTPLDDTPQYTGWFTSPIEQPDELWLDFEFPAGLVHYVSGVRYPLTISIDVQFRAVATPGTVVTKTYSYTASANVAHRITEITTLAELAMVGPIEVRMLRTTPIYADTATEQFIQDTRWKLFRAVKNLPAQTYPDVTLTRLVVFNSQSAASVGESSFNVVATRVLPVLGAGGVLGAAAPSERWCDSLIERMKAADGANKTNAEIDFAGIYAVQAALDAQDGGDAGKISMTLDELQDIDAELQIIASVVRAQVYRIGRKLYVTRDQGGKVPLSLFTARSKAPDGEQVQLAMSNETENDAVIVTWFDRAHGWKQREFQYPAGVPVNPLRVSPKQATWAQAWRRAVYEWNRVQYRRDTLSMQATEEARLLHIGDVVNVTDDIANLAQSAGEVFSVAGLTLTLDREVNVGAGGFTILLRALDGRSVESMPVTQGASLRQVVLAHAPGAPVTVKGRDDGLGTMFAIYQNASAVIRSWLVTNLEPQKDYTRILGVNWRDEVFAGDGGVVPAPPSFRAAGEIE